jgi:hypothetical protein
MFEWYLSACVSFPQKKGKDPFPIYFNFYMRVVSVHYSFLLSKKERERERKKKRVRNCGGHLLRGEINHCIYYYLSLLSLILC